MKIVVLDALPLDADRDLDWSPLRAFGELTLFDRTAPGETAGRVAGASAVLSNKVRIGPAELDAAGPSLQMVSVLATGYDVIDAAAARERGVTVCNVPGYSTPSTAQTTIALLLELCHHAGSHAALVRDGEWRRRQVWSFWEQPSVELDGKTLTLIGAGQVGGRVGRIAEALGMTIIPAQVPGREPSAERAPLNDALSAADVVSLHCPLTPATREMIDAQRLNRMKPNALLLNTARGGLIDEQAVSDALHAGRLGGYAADVLSVEPPGETDSPLLTAPRCLITPHYAWASSESRRRLLDASVKNLQAFLNGAPQNVVNR